MRKLPITAVIFLAAILSVTSLTGCDLASPPSIGSTPTTIASVPQDLPVELGTFVPPVLPNPHGTIDPKIVTPGITPTYPEPTTTPIPAVLQPAVMITTSLVSTVTMGLEVELKVESAVNSVEPVEAMIWAPSGDKLVYGTTSGKLYWSNLDGSNATLLHSYTPRTLRYFIEDQSPLANTLFVRHYGEQVESTLGPSHLDVIRFAPDQAPTVDEADEGQIAYLRGIHWWASDRASGTLPFSYGLPIEGYVGGDKLVTLNAAGRVLEERNIPYIFSGAVKPGGEWLAYSTFQQTTGTPFYGSDPSTAYLLSLRTGQRLQVGPSGSSTVGMWSPDGNWLQSGGLLSADLREQINIPGGASGSWSPDSKRLARADLQEISPDGHVITGWNSEIAIVDIPSRKMAIFDKDSPIIKSIGLVRDARWSPDGSLLAVMTFDPGCQGELCSGTNPAFYLLSVK